MSTTLLRKAIQSADLQRVEAALASCNAGELWPGGTSALIWALFEASEATLAGDAGRRVALRRIAGRLLEAGAPVNAAASDGSTALHFAVLACDTAFVERLLAAGAAADPPDAKDRGGPAAPLALAAQRGYTTIVERLLARGADPTRRDHRGRTAFASALEGGHITTALRLSYGADGRPRPGTLAAVAAAGSLAAVQSLVAAGAELNPPGPLNPLEQALRNGHIEVAEWLAAQGAYRTPASLGLAFVSAGEPVVANVLVGSAADHADVRRGDRLVALAGTAVDTVAELKQLLSRRVVGERVQLQWQRGTRRCEAEAQLLPAAPAPLKFSSGADSLRRLN